MRKCWTQFNVILLLFTIEIVESEQIWTANESSTSQKVHKSIDWKLNGFYLKFIRKMELFTDFTIIWILLFASVCSACLDLFTWRWKFPPLNNFKQLTSRTQMSLLLFFQFIYSSDDDTKRRISDRSIDATRKLTERKRLLFCCFYVQRKQEKAKLHETIERREPSEWSGKWKSHAERGGIRWRNVCSVRFAKEANEERKRKKETSNTFRMIDVDALRHNSFCYSRFRIFRSMAIFHVPFRLWRTINETKSAKWANLFPISQIQQIFMANQAIDRLKSLINFRQSTKLKKKCEKITENPKQK